MTTSKLVLLQSQTNDGHEYLVVAYVQNDCPSDHNPNVQYLILTQKREQASTILSNRRGYPLIIHRMKYLVPRPTKMFMSPTSSNE